MTGIDTADIKAGFGNPELWVIGGTHFDYLPPPIPDMNPRLHKTLVSDQNVTL